MKMSSTPTRATLNNGLVEVRAELIESKLRLTLFAQSGVHQIPILERIGNNDSDRTLRVELPEECSLSVYENGQSAMLVVRGHVSEAEFSINFRLDAESSWVEVSELLVFDARASTTEVDWFEAVWRFVDWQEPGEVFSVVLVPLPDDVIGRHVMRAPALAAQSGDRAAALVNSIDDINRIQALPACMNLLRDGTTPVFRTGLRPHRVRGHVYYEYAPAPARQAGWHHAYHLYVGTGARPGEALNMANRRLWSRYGTRYHKAAPAMAMPIEEYARQIYPRCLDLLWAETQLDGRRVGALRINRAYPNDVWMSPWFSQVRSAYGLFLWGQWLDNKDWVQRALATRDLHLAAPQQSGLFPTVFVFGTTPETYRWVHSHHQGGGPGLYHLFDMSWTVYQLLRWHRDLANDERTLRFAQNYCEGLIRLQAADGSLPAYVDAHDHTPVSTIDLTRLVSDLERYPGGDPYLPHQLVNAWTTDRFVRSAEDAASMLTLATLAHALPPDDAERDLFISAASRCADWIEQWVYPQARWLDFEVYYSCAPKSLDFYDQRSGQWPQGTLCMHLAAAGYLTLYQLTRNARHLELALRAMDRLSLYQQIWDPPFLNLYGFGGYGAINTDGEWNDARQAQFADTHLDFYRLLGDQEQYERALAAARASFTTIFLPASAARYPLGWNREPQGLAAENHAHGGVDHLCGVSGFDWGSGSALATAAYFRLHQIEL